MILASGARGPESNSRMSPVYFQLLIIFWEFWLDSRSLISAWKKNDDCHLPDTDVFLCSPSFLSISEFLLYYTTFGCFFFVFLSILFFTVYFFFLPQFLSIINFSFICYFYFYYLLLRWSLLMTLKGNKISEYRLIDTRHWGSIPSFKTYFSRHRVQMKFLNEVMLCWYGKTLNCSIADLVELRTVKLKYGWNLG